MSEIKIRNAARVIMKEFLGAAQNGELDLGVKVAIMQTEILDEYLEETLRGNKVIEGLLNDIRAEIERSAAADQDQAGPRQPGPAKDDAEPIIDEGIANAQAEIIRRHVKRLSDGLTRPQIIAATKTFVDWIKVDLAKALGCRVYEVPVKLADWIENEQRETAAAGKK